jgi:hypothetical protein
VFGYFTLLLFNATVRPSLAQCLHNNRVGHDKEIGKLPLIALVDKGFHERGKRGSSSSKNVCWANKKPPATWRRLCVRKRGRVFVLATADYAAVESPVERTQISGGSCSLTSRM